MLTLHHLGVSQSDRIVWLLEELDVPYRLVRHDRDPANGQSPASYRALHPSGTAPVIVDGDVTLAETGAIVDWIISRHGSGGLAPTPDANEFGDYLFWLHYANGSFMPAMMMALTCRVLAPDRADEAIRALSARADRAFTLVEERLTACPFLAGSRFTLADLMMHFPLTTMRLYVPHDLSDAPATRAYLKQVAARPAYIRAMRKAEPEFMPPLY